MGTWYYYQTDQHFFSGIAVAEAIFIMRSAWWQASPSQDRLCDYIFIVVYWIPSYQCNYFQGNNMFSSNNASIFQNCTFKFNAYSLRMSLQKINKHVKKCLLWSSFLSSISKELWKTSYVSALFFLKDNKYTGASHF